MASNIDVTVAVCSRSFSRNPVLRQELLGRYNHVQFNDLGLSLTRDDLVDYLQGHSHAIVALEEISAEVIARLPVLKVISKYGVGTDGLDFQALADRRISLGWRGGVNKRAVAELVLCFAIGLLRHLPMAQEMVRGGEWRQLIGSELYGRTIGIIGCGHVGKEVGQLFKAMGCEVLAHDILDFPDYYRTTGVTPVGLEDLLGKSQIVTLHLPLTTSTRQILNRERLALMRDDAILINTARGHLVDEEALKFCLQESCLAAAAFDVFADEPPTDFELLRHPNFLATPHIGGSSEEAVLAMGRAAIEGLSNAAVPYPGDGRWPE